MRKGDQRGRRKTHGRAAKKAVGRGRLRSHAKAPRENSASATSRTTRTLYQLSPRHLLVLKELDRLFPDLAPIVDFAALDPGVESVESVARLLLEILAQRFERPVFLAFGEINSERLLDHIERKIVAGALPLSAQEIFSELMFRLFQRLQDRDRFGRLARLPSDAHDWRRIDAIDARDPARTVFAMLAAGARIVLDEQVAWLRASTIPLPGIPAPCVKPPRSIVSDGSRLLLESSVQLSDGEAERWVAHALMQLPDETRRLIYLRRHKNLDANAIAIELRMKPFDVLLQLKRAEVEFQEQIRATLERFLGREVGEPSKSEAQATQGRLVHWPHARPKSPMNREDEGDAGPLKEPAESRRRPSTGPSQEKEDEGDSDD
jgi:DNA-directed RNA polymerase specialized sigma24 family protein